MITFKKESKSKMDQEKGKKERLYGKALGEEN